MAGANRGGGLALVRLLRLASPALPVGAFGYSQGLETAIRLEWVRDEASLHAWVLDVLHFNLSRCEALMLARLHRAWRARDVDGVIDMNRQVLAARETAELRAESVRMGSSLHALFEATGEFDAATLGPLARMETPAFPTVFAFACAAWEIDEREAMLAYLFAWAENQAAAAMKIMRLGHVAAQRMLARIGMALPALVEGVVDAGDVVSNFAPALAIASSLHETQDGRVFRS